MVHSARPRACHSMLSVPLFARSVDPEPACCGPTHRRPHRTLVACLRPGRAPCDDPVVKLHIASDLHLEFAPFEPEACAWQAADVVVLAGDIDTGVHGIQWAAQAFPGKPVLYVAGNHEFYGHHWTYLLAELRETALACGVSLLEDDVVEIGGWRFVGCSLWTDFELFGEERRGLAMSATEKALMDYRRIKADPVEEGLARGRRRRLTAHHTRLRHQHSRAWLERELASGDPARTVVITHHYPDRRSCPSQYADDLVSAGFGSQLRAELLTRAGLWIHGHTHESADYMVDAAGATSRVVANPRGYPLAAGRFENPAFDPGLLVNLP